MTGAAALEADIEIDASPDQVWSVISDIARMGEWSPECRKVMVFGATRKGAHVVGLNRRRWVVWPTNSRIVRYEPGRTIAWRVYENRAIYLTELTKLGAQVKLLDPHRVMIEGPTHFSGTEIGSDCTIGHNAIVHACTVEDFCLIGMGSILLDGARIGRGSLVGAGALVTPGTHIPPGSLVIGSPAKVKRPLNDKEREQIESGAKHYVELARRYLAGG